MAKQTINNGETYGVIRGKLNSMFTNLYSFIDITGTLGIGNGGTGATSASGARDALGVQYGTTAGTVLEGNRDAEYAKLASANEFTADQTISGGTPTLFLDETDNLSWRLRINSDKLEFIRSASILGAWTSTGLGINKTNPGSKFAVSGLPTSSTGLTSGDVWRNGTVLNIIA